jgi:hypothetical protein
MLWLLLLPKTSPEALVALQQSFNSALLAKSSQRVQQEQFVSSQCLVPQHRVTQLLVHLKASVLTSPIVDIGCQLDLRWAISQTPTCDLSTWPLLGFLKAWLGSQDSRTGIFIVEP